MPRHLIHVGYPKAGSSYLQRWFEAHPQLAYLEGGIAGFRDVYGMVRTIASADAGIVYRVTSSEAFTAPRADCGRTTVDYTSSRAFDAATAQARACDFLAELFPNAAILIVTRGFRSMVLSSYSQYLRSGGDEELADLIEIVRGDRSSAAYGHLLSLASWNYDALIAAYVEKFGRDAVIVLPYELLRDDPARFTRTLAVRLGIDDVAGPRSRVNESLSAVELRWYPRLTRWMRRILPSGLFARYARAAFEGRLGGVIRILDRIRPLAPGDATAIPDDVLEPFRGNAESLRAEPLYRPYVDEYLL